MPTIVRVPAKPAAVKAVSAQPKIIPVILTPAGGGDGPYRYRTEPSSVVRTFSAKLDDFLSAKDKGVVADGVADDTAALRLAISSAIANNVPLLIPGKVRITAPVDVGTPRGADSLAIHGIAGNECGGIIVDFSPTAPGDAGLFASGGSDRVSGPALRNLELSYGPAATTGKAPALINFHRVGKVSINDVRCTGYSGSTAVRMSSVWNSRIDRLQIWGAGDFRASISSPNAQYSIAAGSGALTSDIDVFIAAAVGHV